MAVSRVLGTDDHGFNNIYAEVLTCGRFQAAKSSNNTQTFRVYANTGGNVRVAVYNDNAGAPGTRLTYNNTEQAVSAGDNTLSITAASITSGSYYWLVAIGDTTGCLRMSDDGTGTRRTSGMYSYSGFTFPETLDLTGGTTGTQNVNFALYGEDASGSSASSSPSSSASSSPSSSASSSPSGSASNSPSSSESLSPSMSASGSPSSSPSTSGSNSPSTSASSSPSGSPSTSASNSPSTSASSSPSSSPSTSVSSSPSSSPSPSADIINYRSKVMAMLEDDDVIIKYDITNDQLIVITEENIFKISDDSSYNFFIASLE